jgi:anthranilate/para-aminobenzoate synthase component II
MANKTELAARFAVLKAERDECSRSYATTEGKIASAKERFNMILRELAANYQIYSYDDLVSKKKELEDQISQEAVDLEASLEQMKKELQELESLV